MFFFFPLLVVMIMCRSSVSVDHTPGSSRISLHEVRAAAASHEEDVAKLQGRQEQLGQTAG